MSDALSLAPDFTELPAARPAAWSAESPLSKARKGQRGVIVRVGGETGRSESIDPEELERRLLEMGFVEGAAFEVLHEGCSAAIRSPCASTTCAWPCAAARPRPSPSSSKRPDVLTDTAVSRPARLALVGNPNSGKTALFNALTGSRQKVANYAGVTVERKEGVLTLPGGRGAHMCWTCPAPTACGPAAPTRW
jgi:ferrous iron transport protein A